MPSEPENDFEEGLPPSPLPVFVWNLLGALSLLAGLIGALLPVLPTTPFLLLAAACFFRGSKRMYRWMLTNRWFGKELCDYREGRGIPLKSKVIALVMLWLSIIFSAIFFAKPIWARLLLLLIASVISTKILLSPTRR